VTGALAGAAARLAAARRAGSLLALVLDYDGTLTPLVAHPDLACLDPRVRELLRRLAACPGVAVGVLSGRTLDDVREKVGLPGLYYGGTSGLELDLRGRVVVPPAAEAGRPLIGRLAEQLEVVAVGCPGAWVERKSFGLTLHYRAAPLPHRLTLLAQASEVLQQQAERLRVVPAARAVEVTLAVGLTKGTALRQLALDAGPDVLPLYAGDEANDAEALEAAAMLGGIAVGVGPAAPSLPPPLVLHCLPDPGALHVFLADLLGALK
jgi:trehalose-phosphatase